MNNHKRKWNFQPCSMILLAAAEISVFDMIEHSFILTQNFSLFFISRHEQNFDRKFNFQKREEKERKREKKKFLARKWKGGQKREREKTSIFSFSVLIFPIFQINLLSDRQQFSTWKVFSSLPSPDRRTERQTDRQTDRDCMCRTEWVSVKNTRIKIKKKLFYLLSSTFFIGSFKEGRKKESSCTRHDCQVLKVAIAVYAHLTL